MAARVGGDGFAGLIHSAESRAKRSVALTGREVSAATREAISRANTGKRRTEEQRARTGRPIGIPATEKWKRTISEKLTGRSRDKQTREKISRAKAGKTFSESHKAALRAAWVRRKMKGKTGMKHRIIQEIV